MDYQNSRTQDYTTITKWVDGRTNLGHNFVSDIKQNSTSYLERVSYLDFNLLCPNQYNACKRERVFISTTVPISELSQEVWSLCREGAVIATQVIQHVSSVREKMMRLGEREGRESLAELPWLPGDVGEERWKR